MKILQVITKSSLGGAQSVVISLANSFCAMGHEVIVAAGADDGLMWALLDARVAKEECPTLQRALSPVKDLRAVWALRRLYRKHRPDIVHLHSSKAGMLGRMAFPPRKTVYTVHGFDSIRIAFRTFLPVERLMQRRCAAIVGVSHHDVRTMAEEGIHRNVTCVYNGIERPAASGMREDAWAVPDGKYRKTVLCIARLSSPKRHDLFLEVAALLPEYAFVWIGNQTMVREHPSNVFFLGSITQARCYCRKADLFILPSNYEGLPMVILEAMSLGLPVVASDVGGVSEVVVDGENGFAVENTAEAFADRISCVLEDDALYAAFSRNATARYEKEFTVSHMVDGYRAIYRQLADM